MKTTEFTLENLKAMYANLHKINVPKKIKVTSDFYDYLVAKTKDEVVLHKDDDLPNGYYGTFTGIPIEIDDAIENEYYELVYPKEN